MFSRIKIAILGFTTILIIINFSSTISAKSKFNGIRAYDDMITQLTLGSRILGSLAHTQEEQFISDSIVESGWNYQYQDAVVSGISIRNIIGFREKHDDSSFIIIGAHYDSRRLENFEDTNITQEGIPGANDGASGVALLLELMRTLPEKTLPIWFVFFDAEEYYGIEDKDGSIGARYFVEKLTAFPRFAIIVDMVGDNDLDIYYEGYSDNNLNEEIWEIAHDLGHFVFIPEVKYFILDDHLPFQEVGIPSTLIIDFDYPYWHTVLDTADKVSPDSLDIVGDTLWTWIVNLNK